MRCLDPYSIRKIALFPLHECFCVFSRQVLAVNHSVDFFKRMRAIEEGMQRSAGNAASSLEILRSQENCWVMYCKLRFFGFKAFWERLPSRNKVIICPRHDNMTYIQCGIVRGKTGRVSLRRQFIHSSIDTNVWLQIVLSEVCRDVFDYVCHAPFLLD